MKKIILITTAVASVLFFTAFIFSPGLSKTALKAGKDSKPIPADVMTIAKKACVNCHAEPGNKMALSKVNLTKWDEYSPGKQAAKAKAMCNMVSKNKMPPKNFRKKHPDAVPTQEDSKTLCDWAESLKVTK